MIHGLRAEFLAAMNCHRKLTSQEVNVKADASGPAGDGTDFSHLAEEDCGRAHMHRAATKLANLL